MPGSVPGLSTTGASPVGNLGAHMPKKHTISSTPPQSWNLPLSVYSLLSPQYEIFPPPTRQYKPHLYGGSPPMSTKMCNLHCNECGFLLLASSTAVTWYLYLPVAVLTDLLRSSPFFLDGFSVMQFELTVLYPCPKKIPIWLCSWVLLLERAFSLWIQKTLTRYICATPQSSPSLLSCLRSMKIRYILSILYQVVWFLAQWWSYNPASPSSDLCPPMFYPPLTMLHTDVLHPPPPPTCIQL